MGELFDRDTEARGERWATADHLDTRCGRWNLQLQLGRHVFDPDNPVGIAGDTVRLGGFATPYDVAGEGCSASPTSPTTYRGGLDEIRSQVRAWNVKWHVVDLELADAVRGCEEGLLVEIDPSMPPAAPRSLDDCFNVRELPGRGGIRRTPKANLERALMADGVPPGKGYQALSTEAGLDRTFRALTRIKPHVRWWSLGEEAVRMLETGRVTMTTTYKRAHL
ncbi:MAG: extracellular solute-binding protein [Gammaproteobacteria bacterium]|nr:extracellular solute-binding protein [Gammaproteobacteria bacterium]